MKAARYYGRGDVRVEDVPEPGSPGADEVVASGLRRRRLETRRAFSGEASRNGRNVANL